MVLQMNLYRIDYEVDSDSDDETSGPPPYSPLSMRPGYQAVLSSNLGSPESAPSSPPPPSSSSSGLVLRNGKRLIDREDEAGEAEAKKNERTKYCPLRIRIEWLRKNYCRPPALTLREKSARAVADTWSDRYEVWDRLEEMGRSPAASAFKAEIGVHLKGDNLVAFIRREGGLDALSQRSWPEVFQRLLRSVYAEMSRFDLAYPAKKELSRSIKAFRHKTLKRETLQVGVHRLGLTDMFYQPQLKGLDRQLWSFHQKEAFKDHVMIDYPPLKYPLPPVLCNTNRAQAALYDRCYPINTEVANKEAAWRRKVSSEVREREERGLELSKETKALFRSSLHPIMFWSNGAKKPLSERHAQLLITLVKLGAVGSHKVAVTAAFLILTHPFYSLDRIRLEEPELAPRFRDYRVDIYRVLSKSLAWLHASLDLPLAVLHLAKLHVHATQPPCLSELARLALIELEIHVRYGHYVRAGELFWSWFGCLPSSSRLFEEMVTLYCFGVFSSVQEQLMEALLTEGAHRDCNFTTGCWELYVKPIAQAAGNKIFRLRCLLHRCESDVTVTDKFRRVLEQAQIICSFFNLCVLKISSRHRELFVLELKVWQERCTWSRWAGPELATFTYPVPRDVTDRDGWRCLVEYVRDYENRSFGEISSTGDYKRNNADFLFSLLLGLLLHQFNGFTYKHLIRECLETYKKSTVGRHHRIPLLEKLVDLHEGGDKLVVKPHKYLNEEEREVARKVAEARGDKYRYPTHPTAKKEEVSYGELTVSAIRAFSISTMQDCLEDFERQDFSSADQFCRYLRERDDAAPAWIEFGLKCFRFDHYVRNGN